MTESLRQPYLVRVAGPTAVEPDHAFSEKEWSIYNEQVWQKRLAARHHVRYFALFSRWMSNLAVGLQILTLLGGSAAVAALLDHLPVVAGIVAGLVVSASSFTLLVTGLGNRIGRASFLEEAWSARALFWDDAWRQVQGGAYLGSLMELAEPEFQLRQVEAELRLPQPRVLVARLQREVMEADPEAHRQTEMA